MYNKQITATHSIRQLETAEFLTHIRRSSKRILKGSLFEKAARPVWQKREGPEISIHLGLFSGSDFIGWTTGFHIDSATFYIDNSAIDPKWQGQGLYTHLLESMVRCAVELGFQTIKCHHYAGLSKLIAKKLRMGFFITGVEVSDEHGVTLQMDYYANTKRLEVLKFRVGDIRATKFVKKVLELC